MAGSERRGDGSRARHRGRGRSGAAPGRGRGGGDRQPQDPAARHVAAAAARARGLDAAAASSAPSADDDDDAAADDAEICVICANPVAHHSIAPCNHTTCHICGLRMRALYKTKDCAHCRTPAPFVVFTDDAGKRFEDYGPDDITTTDSNIGIQYTNEDIVGDTVLLLRYNCPDPSCDFAGLGWPDLHRHVKSVHSKRMCDLCTRNKKVFTHEHELYADRDLDRHMRHGDDKPGAADQTGFKGHPLCGFCGERFYDDDKLYEHCRMKHERCFICDRRDSRKPHYYRDYNALEQHFKDDHYLCHNSECLEKKFVVFESEMDLQAHQLSEHAGKAAGRDARVVDMSAFAVRQAYQQERRGGAAAGRGQRDGEARGRGRNRGGRGRDPNGDAVPPTSAQPLRRDELAFQRQMAIHSAQSVSTRTFGGQLTPAPAPAQPSASRQASRSSTPRAASSATAPGQGSVVDPMEALAVTDAAAMAPEERARLLRHSAVVERATNLLGNDAAKVAQFRDHISSYRRSGLAAPQLIDAFFTVFGDVSSNALGTLVREVADLYEDKAKADALRKAWQDWRAINEDYPSLPGLSGMHGATSSSSGWATASAASPAVPTAAPSQKHWNRVLKLKNSTRLGGPAPSSPRGPPGWAAATTSSSSPSPSPAFPSLPAAARRPAAPSAGPAPRPSWLGPAPQSAPPSRSATPSSGARARGEDAFPALPAAPKPMTTLFGYGSGRGVRRDYGHASSGFQWGATAAPPAAGSAAAAASAAAATEHDDAEAAAGGGGGAKGKKGGKKGKKVLVQWG